MFVTKLLIKKELQQIFKSYFYNTKKNKARSKASTILCFLGFAAVMFGILGVMFGTLASSMCATLSSLGLDWLYFILMTLMSIVMGVFGTVFTTYSSLYMAKDNDMLLSLPLPVRSILISRIFATYVMDIMYAGVVFIPTIIVYSMNDFSFKVLISSLLFFIQLTLFILTLSCALGYVVAKLSTKLKNKSYITTIASLLLIGIYYFVYYKASVALQSFLENALFYGDILKDKVYLLYLLGQACTGNFLYLLITIVVSIALSMLVWCLLKKSFLKILSATNKVEKLKVKKLDIRQGGVFSSLVKKELARFTSSSAYMLNASMGSVLMIVLMITIIVKKDILFGMFHYIEGEYISMGILVIFFFLISTNYMGACSISMEGKNIWITKSLPVNIKDILLSKVAFHAMLTIIPALIASLIVCVILKINPIILLAVLIAGIFYSLMNVSLNVLMPSLHWTNEISVIKQSGCSMLAAIGGWIYPIVFIVLSVLCVKQDLNITIFMLVWMLVTLIVSILLYRWLTTKGCRKYLDLN